MSADELQQAAETLRSLATGANEGYHPGDEDPWFTVPSANSIRTKWVTFAEAYKAEAPYIAAMSPELGVALADLLDFTANEHEGDGPEGCWECIRWMTLTRLINGGAS